MGIAVQLNKDVSMCQNASSYYNCIKLWPELSLYFVPVSGLVPSFWFIQSSHFVQTVICDTGSEPCPPLQYKLVTGGPTCGLTVRNSATYGTTVNLPHTLRGRPPTVSIRTTGGSSSLEKLCFFAVITMQWSSYRSSFFLFIYKVRYYQAFWTQTSTRPNVSKKTDRY